MRRRRNTTEQLCDAFADLPLESQEGILLTLGEIHRQAKRRAVKEQPTGARGLPQEIPAAILKDPHCTGQPNCQCTDCVVF
jgi:hypothetical protein